MTAYALYNEIDDYAADWLENLIKLGHIAPGIVDRRSIEDIRGDDLRGFRQVHFFAGIGVWSYALRRAGISDDTALWTGSCPCQPFSAAGKGDGMDDERHLWPALLHLIRERRPEQFFGEQVASKDGLGWLDLVQTDMEAEGYAIGAVDTCSAGSGAPHIRQRLRIAAYDLRTAAGRLAFAERRHAQLSPWAWARPGEAQSAGSSGKSDGRSDTGWLVDSIEQGLEGLGNRFAAEGGHGEGAFRPASEASEFDGLADDDDDGQRSSASAGLLDDEHHLEPRDGADGLEHSSSSRREWGKEAAPGYVDDGQASERQQDQHGVVVADASGVHQYGAGPTNGFWRDADWLFCRDEKWRPVRPGSFPLVDGASFRMDSGSAYAGKSRQGMLKAFGNAIDAEATIDFLDACLEHRTIELEAVADLAAGSVEGLLV